MGVCRGLGWGSRAYMRVCTLGWGWEEGSKAIIWESVGG